MTDLFDAQRRNRPPLDPPKPAAPTAAAPTSGVGLREILGGLRTCKTVKDVEDWKAFCTGFLDQLDGVQRHQADQEFAALRERLAKGAR